MSDALRSTTLNPEVITIPSDFNSYNKRPKNQIMPYQRHTSAT